MDFLEAESGTLTLKRHQDRIRSELRETESRLRSLTEQNRKTEAEPDWMAFAKILQSHLHESPCALDARYRLLDFTTGQEVWIPADAGLNALQQMERFFHLAKRKKRRLEEASTRTRDLLGRKSELLSRLEALDRLEPGQDPDSLFPDRAPRVIPPKEAKRIQGFSGPTYRSIEGFPILVGRNREENSDLTFKIARGNDVWLHVKGRPGSHAVILLPAGKTASLETLIDAAVLCLLHSGGREWGKTEVDYTWRKHVKKIKNSSEVSYTQNRTLTVAVEEERILGITSRSG
jgi:predicted ribosome quality control (RQC) complex YloA/Tae2 family protein